MDDFGFIWGIVIVAWLFVLALYVIGALAYRKVLKCFGYDKPWMAWIPFADNFALVDSLQYGDTADLPFGINVPIIIVKLYPLISSLVGAIPIPVLPQLVSLAVRLVCGYWMLCHVYGLIDNKDPSEEKSMAILSLFIFVIQYVKFFKAKPVDVAAYYGDTSYSSIDGYDGFSSDEFSTGGSNDDFNMFD